MTPVLIPCSRTAHDQNLLARRPQWDPRRCHSRREERARLEGLRLEGWGRSMARTTAMTTPAARLDTGKG